MDYIQFEETDINFKFHSILRTVFQFYGFGLGFVNIFF